MTPQTTQTQLSPQQPTGEVDKQAYQEKVQLQLQKLNAQIKNGKRKLRKRKLILSWNIKVCYLN